MATKVYHFELEGFSDTVTSTSALQARVAELKVWYPYLVGKVCKINVGTRTGSGYDICDRFVGAPILKTVQA